MTSLSAYNQEEKVLGKHEYFFKYLQISPSYWLAHKKLALKENTPSRELPDDFKAVLALYKKVGDVFTNTFHEWWKLRGKDLFADSKPTNKVWLSVDLSKSRDELLADYSKFLDALEAKNRSKQKSACLQLETNKIRLTSLRQRLHLVTERAQHIENKIKKETLWSIGKSSGIASKWTKHIRLDSKRTSKNTPVRNYLSILVSKNLKDALTIAENAARGKFPSLAQTESNLNFDYINIKVIQAKQLKLFWMSLVSAETKGDNWKELFDPSGTTIRSRRKKPESMDLGFDMESQYEAWLNSQATDEEPHAPKTEYEMLVDAEERLIKARRARK